MSLAKVKEIILKRYCDICRNQMKSDQAKIKVEVYRWYEPGKGSTVEMECCDKCAKKMNLYDLAANARVTKELLRKNK